MLGLGLSAASVPMMGKSLIQRAISILRRYGTDAHVYLPGGNVMTYGPELVTNGNFSNGTIGWVGSNATISTVNGELLVTATGAVYPTAIQRFDAIIGKTYELTATFRRGTCTLNASADLSGMAGSNKQNSSTNNITVVSYGVATTTRPQVSVFINGATALVGDTLYAANVSVREVLSNSSVILNGLTAGNYELPSKAAVNDNPVGLVLDAMGTVGPELVTNGDFSAGKTGWGDYLQTSTVVAGELQATYTSLGNTYQSVAMVVGKTYLVQACLRSISGSLGGYIRAQDGSGTFTIRQSSQHVTASANTQVFFYHTCVFTPQNIQVVVNSGATVAADNISVREVTGIHATQTTAGFKPRLVRGAYNMLTNSATMGTQSVTTGANTYCLSFTGTGTVTKSGTATGALVGTGVGNRVKQTFTSTAGTLTLTVTGSVTLAMLELL